MNTMRAWQTTCDVVQYSVDYDTGQCSARRVVSCTGVEYEQSVCAIDVTCTVSCMSCWYGRRWQWDGQVDIVGALPSAQPVVLLCSECGEHRMVGQLTANE